MNYDHILFDDDNNYRSRYSEASISELAASMQSVHEQTDGDRWLLQPVGVAPLPEGHEARAEGKTHKLVFGYRRFHAIETLIEDGKNWAKDVPTVEVTEDDTRAEVDTLHSQLVENLQREDPNVMDTAFALDRLRDLLGDGKKKATQKQLAQTVGKSDGWVAQRLRLLSMHNDVQDALQEGDIEISHARELQRLAKGKNKKVGLQQQADVLAEAIKKSWTFDQLKKRVQKILDIEEAEKEAAAAAKAAGEEAPEAKTTEEKVEAADTEATDEEERAKAAKGKPDGEDRLDPADSGETPADLAPTTQMAETLVVPHNRINAQVSNLKRSVLSSFKSFQTEEDADDKNMLSLEAAFFAGAQRTLQAMLGTPIDDLDFEEQFDGFLADARRFGLTGVEEQGE